MNVKVRLSFLIMFLEGGILDTRGSESFLLRNLNGGTYNPKSAWLLVDQRRRVLPDIDVNKHFRSVEKHIWEDIRNFHTGIQDEFMTPDQYKKINEIMGTDNDDMYKEDMYKDEDNMYKDEDNMYKDDVHTEDMYTDDMYIDTINKEDMYDEKAYKNEQDSAVQQLDRVQLLKDNEPGQKHEQDRGPEQIRELEQKPGQEQQHEQESDPYRLPQDRFDGRRKRFRSNQKQDRITEQERERNTEQERERNTEKERARITEQERNRITEQERVRITEQQDPFHKYFSEERNEPSFARLIADNWEEEEREGEKIETTEPTKTIKSGFVNWDTEKEWREIRELEKKEEDRKKIEAWEEMRKNMDKRKRTEKPQIKGRMRIRENLPTRFTEQDRSTLQQVSSPGPLDSLSSPPRDLAELGAIKPGSGAALETGVALGGRWGPSAAPIGAAVERQLSGNRFPVRGSRPGDVNGSAVALLSFLLLLNMMQDVMDRITSAGKRRKKRSEPTS